MNLSRSRFLLHTIIFRSHLTFGGCICVSIVSDIHHRNINKILAFYHEIDAGVVSLKASFGKLLDLENLHPTEDSLKDTPTKRKSKLEIFSPLSRENIGKSIYVDLTHHLETQKCHSLQETALAFDCSIHRIIHIVQLLLELYRSLPRTPSKSAKQAAGLARGWNHFRGKWNEVYTVYMSMPWSTHMIINIDPVKIMCRLEYHCWSSYFWDAGLVQEEQGCFHSRPSLHQFLGRLGKQFSPGPPVHQLTGWNNIQQYPTTNGPISKKQYPTTSSWFACSIHQLYGCFTCFFKPPAIPQSRPVLQQHTSGSVRCIQILPTRETERNWSLWKIIFFVNIGTLP